MTQLVYSPLLSNCAFLWISLDIHKKNPPTLIRLTFSPVHLYARDSFVSTSFRHISICLLPQRKSFQVSLYCRVHSYSYELMIQGLWVAGQNSVLIQKPNSMSNFSFGSCSFQTRCSAVWQSTLKLVEIFRLQLQSSTVNRWYIRHLFILGVVRGENWKL